MVVGEQVPLALAQRREEPVEARVLAQRQGARESLQRPEVPVEQWVLLQLRLPPPRSE